MTEARLVALPPTRSVEMRRAVFTGNTCSDELEGKRSGADVLSPPDMQTGDCLLTMSTLGCCGSSWNWSMVCCLSFSNSPEHFDSGAPTHWLPAVCPQSTGQYCRSAHCDEARGSSAHKGVLLLCYCDVFIKRRSDILEALNAPLSEICKMNCGTEKNEMNRIE